MGESLQSTTFISNRLVVNEDARDCQLLAKRYPDLCSALIDRQLSAQDVWGKLWSMLSSVALPIKYFSPRVFIIVGESNRIAD